MKKILIAAILLLSAFCMSFAETSVGFFSGYPGYGGATFKFDNIAIGLSMGSYIDATVDYWFMHDKLDVVKGLKWHVGAGFYSYLGLGRSIYFGIGPRVPIGVDFMLGDLVKDLKKDPFDKVEFYWDCAPALAILPMIYFDFQTAVGVRYHFGAGGIDSLNKAMKGSGKEIDDRNQ